MGLSTRLEMGNGIEGLEEEREGMEVGLDAMGAHANEDGQWRLKRDGGLDMGSNDIVPDKGFEGAVSKVKSRVREGNELLLRLWKVASGETSETHGTSSRGEFSSL